MEGRKKGSKERGRGREREVARTTRVCCHGDDGVVILVVVMTRAC